MNEIIGTLMIFSVILLTFFGLPIAGLFIWSSLFPANIGPLSVPIGINSTINIDQEPLGFPIYVRKVKSKGNIIWVDAVDPVQNRF